jgi:hypothetical protein
LKKRIYLNFLFIASSLIKELIDRCLSLFL